MDAIIGFEKSDQAPIGFMLSSGSKLQIDFLDLRMTANHAFAIVAQS
jgi:hypothetical protein